MSNRRSNRSGRRQGRTNKGVGNPTLIQTIIAIEGEILDDETCTWGPDRVYFMRAGEAIKIGVTRNLKQRRSEIQTSNSQDVHMIGALVGGRHLEEILHHRFREHHIRGEWFSVAILPDILDMVEQDRDYFEMRGIKVAA